jgi:hypothetical protein
VGHPEPSLPTIKTLFALSGNVCAFRDPTSGRGCEAKLTDPSWTRVRARICHIRGYAPGSARFDEDQADEDRNSFDNLLLLCPNHHVEVDDLRSADFTVEVLQKMKARAESRWSETWASDTRLEDVAVSIVLDMRASWKLWSDLAESEAELRRARASYEWLLAADNDPAEGPWFHSEMKFASGRVRELEAHCAELRLLLHGAAD